MRGGMVTRDHVVLVRKRGDALRAAPCCRHTAHVTGQQAGRPVHETEYRHESTLRHATELGWSREYMEKN